VRVTEAPGGVFDDTLAAAPRLANQVGRLRREHIEIADGLDRVTVTAAGLDDPAVDATREESLAVMGAIVRHRSAGSSLLYEAYFVDIDAAD
jgi:hypothetical protein